MKNNAIEKSVLGTILLEESMSLLDGLSLMPYHFSTKTHQLIYSFLLKLHKENKPISILALSEELRICDKLKDIGGISYLSSIITFATTTVELPYYIKKLKNFHQNKQLSKQLIEASKLLETEDFQSFSQKLFDLQNIVYSAQNYDELFSDFSQISDEQAKFVKTGFLKLDKVTHGLEYGTLSILTGEPGSGKSTLLNQIIANIIADNQNIFLYSGELTQQKLKTWLFHTFANQNDIVAYKDEFGEYKSKINSKVVKKLENYLKNKLFLFNNEKPLNSQNLYNIVSYTKRNKNVNCFVFDNLMTLVANESGYDSFQQQKQIINTLNKLSKDLDVVIILVAHPNKESSKNINPSMFDVAGVSEIVNLADYVFKIISDENCSYVHVLKNRIEGTTDVFLRLFFSKERRRFYTQDGNELVQKYI